MCIYIYICIRNTRIYLYIYIYVCVYVFFSLFFLIRYNCSWSRERSLSEDTICGITTAFSLSTFLVLLPNFLSCTFHNYMLPLLFYRLRFIVYGPIMGPCCLLI